MRFQLVLLAHSLLSAEVVGGQALTSRDSAQIAGQVASYFAPQLRPSKGATSTNAVCVKVVSAVRGSFARSLESSLRNATGGVTVAPRTSLPLRSIEVTRLHRSRDTVFVSIQTSGGGLRAGESSSGTQQKIAFVRSGSAWSRPIVGPVEVGDGFVHKTKPKPPSPPKC